MDDRIRVLNEIRDKAEERTFPDQDSLIPFRGGSREGGARVLHIVPFTYYEKGCEFLGSAKDIDGRQQYLWQCGAPFDTFRHLKNRRRLSDELSFFHLPDYTHVIVDLSKSWDELAYLKRRWPKAKLIVRSHNPEVAHRIDYVRATRRINSTRGERQSSLINLGVYFKRELGVVRHADAILHIETENTAWYWRALGFRGELLVTPYYTTDYYLRPSQNNSLRRKQVVCLASSHPGPLIAEMVSNFHRAVKGLDGEHRDYAFCATGDMPSAIRPEDLSDRVLHLGLVEDVLSLLAGTFAVAVTSDLGRGFKTKILESIMCGAWVIVAPGLMKRMPEVLKPYCAVLDPAKPDQGLACALDELSGREWPKGDPNAVLREEAYRALDSAIFSEPRKVKGAAQNPAFASATAGSAS